MAAPKVSVFELDINTNALITKMTQTRAEIEKLKQAQNALAKEGQSNSDAFSKNEVELKRLQSAYISQKNVVAQLTSEESKFASASQAITSALAQENTTIEKARANNTQLLAVRNQLNLKTTEGQAALSQINAKLDQNNAFIKENVSAYEKQKIGIGDYARGITESAQALGLEGTEMRNVKAIMEKLAGPLGTLNEGFSQSVGQIKNAAAETQGLSTTQKAMAVSSNIASGAFGILKVALAAVGIGLIISAIVLLIGYFKTFDPLIDAMEQAFAGLSAAVRVVSQTLGTFVTGITSVGDALNKLGNFIKNPIGSLKALGTEMKNAANEAANLKAEQQELADAMNAQEIANARASQQYAELILQSKNRTLSEEERLAALKKAEAIESQNFKQRTVLADKDINQAIEAARIKGALLDQEVENLEKYGTAYAIRLLNAGKITDAEVEMIKAAELKKIGIQDESTKRLEKNQNQQDKLFEQAQEKKAKEVEKAQAQEQKMQELRQKALDDTATKMKLELDLFTQANAQKSQTLQGELALAEEVKNKKLAIAQAEFNASSKTKNDELTLLKAQNDARKEFADSQLASVQQYAKAEFDLFLTQNRSKLEGAKTLTQELIAEEARRVEAIAAEKLNLIALEKGTNQQVIDAKRAANEELSLVDLEYLTAKSELELEAQATLEANKDAYEVQVKELKAEQLKVENEVALAEAQTKFEEQQILEDQRYSDEVIKLNERLANKNLTQEQYDIIADDNKKKHADIQLRIEQIKNQQQRDEASALFGGLAQLLGEHTAAGKAAAIAQATINTYSGIANVWGATSVLPEPLATAGKVISTAVVLASGLAAVKKITSTKVPSRAGGGIIPRLGAGVIDNGSNLAIPISTGDDTLAYVKQGEIILNEEQQRKAGGSIFFRSLGVPGFASGGIVGGNTNIATAGGFKIDLDLLAGKMAEANRSLPTPRVGIDEITATMNRVAVVENGANF